MDPAIPVTLAIQQAALGDPQAGDQAYRMLEQALRAKAAALMAHERPGHTLQPTVLMSDAYLQLMRQSGVKWQSRGHFLAVASTMMRRVLIDHAKARRAQKRGRGVKPADVSIHAIEGKSIDLATVITVDEALQELAKIHPRPAQVVEMKFFAGATNDEVAEAIQASPRTVDADWRFARAWLAQYFGTAT